MIYFCPVLFFRYEGLHIDRHVAVSLFACEAEAAGSVADRRHVHHHEHGCATGTALAAAVVDRPTCLDLAHRRRQSYRR